MTINDAQNSHKRRCRVVTEADDVWELPWDVYIRIIIAGIMLLSVGTVDFYCLCKKYRIWLVRFHPSLIFSPRFLLGIWFLDNNVACRFHILLLKLPDVTWEFVNRPFLLYLTNAYWGWTKHDKHINVSLQMTLATFITYTLSGGVLDANKAFTALSLFNITRFPMSQLPTMITFMVNVSITSCYVF